MKKFISIVIVLTAITLLEGLSISEAQASCTNNDYAFNFFPYSTPKSDNAAVALTDKLGELLKLCSVKSILERNNTTLDVTSFSYNKPGYTLGYSVTDWSSGKPFGQTCVLNISVTLPPSLSASNLPPPKIEYSNKCSAPILIN